MFGTWDCALRFCRQLALKYHPDKAAGPGQREAADKLFKLISAAHGVLSSIEQRRQYDLSSLRRQMMRARSRPLF